MITIPIWLVWAAGAVCLALIIDNFRRLQKLTEAKHLAWFAETKLASAGLEVLPIKEFRLAMESVRLLHKIKEL